MIFDGKSKIGPKDTLLRIDGRLDPKKNGLWKGVWRKHKNEEKLM